MGRKQIAWIFGGLTLISAGGAWFSVWRAFNVESVGLWLVPTLAFSAYAIFLLLFALLATELVSLELLLSLSLLLSFVFTRQWWHLAVLVVIGFLLLYAVDKIRGDMEHNLRFSVWKSVQAGRSLLIWSLALAIGAQYFFMLKARGGELAIPRLDIAPITQQLTAPLLQHVLPVSNKLTSGESLTVDEFILEAQQNQNAELTSEEELAIKNELPEEMSEEEKVAMIDSSRDGLKQSKQKFLDKSRELALVEGRKKFSQLAGKELTGQEKVSIVFGEMVNKKINDYFNPPMGRGEKASSVPLFLTIILLLTIVPLGYVLLPLWILVAKGVFEGLKKMQILKIRIVTVEKEILE